jgi:outer membrane protein assembly factor BamB
MRLRAYALPIEKPRGEPLPMNPEPRMGGWIWFAPHQDHEKVVQVTDAGRLALVGVKQKRNDDFPLFFLVPQNPLDKNLGMLLEPLLKPDLTEKETRSRSQIVYAAEPDNFWVLALGKLLRLRLLLAARGGPTVRPAWEKAIPLGSPLHEAQFFEYPFDAGAEKLPTLMLVTDPVNREVCLATAVDARDGTIRWQRQLGLVSRGEPVMLGQRLVALDQGGGLFTFDAARPAGDKDEWLVGSLSIATSLDDGEAPPILVPRPDGKAAYEFAIPIVPKTGPNPPALILRRIVDKGGPKPLVEVHQHPLREQLALAGKPAINESGILVPLSDGSILRFNLDGTFAGQGPSWKVGDDPETQTFIIWLNSEEFITTHGGNNINRWQWTGKNRFILVPVQDNPADPTKRMPANIATEPFVLPPEKEGEGVRVLIACEDRTLYLLEGRAPKAVKLGEEGLRVDKKATLKGKPTGGPFKFGENILVIVDRNRLVCLKPGELEPLWEYESQGDAIVGQPQLIDAMLLVANQSGQFVGLDPKTGKPLGKGYTIRANVGPACSPVAFGKNQAFAPLTDGTILLLDLNQLRQ